MKSYLFLLYFNCISVNSKNYIVYLPGPNSRRMMDRVMWRVNKPIRFVSVVPNRGIELHLLKVPYSDSVHTSTRKPQDQKTFPIARAMTAGVTRSLPGTSLNKPSNTTASKNFKKLASKEDVFKALNELAEKRKALHKCSNKAFHQPENTKQLNTNANQQNEPIVISVLNQANGKTIKAKNLDEVLQLLKGGITADRIPGSTTTENIHWMRIKIPKSGH